MCAQYSKPTRWPAATLTSPGQGDDEAAASIGRARRSTIELPAATGDMSPAARPAGCLLPVMFMDSPGDIRGVCLPHATRKLVAGAMDDYLVERRMQMQIVRSTRQKLESTM